jgi:tetratricopeptide (TPR) repeat protein
MGGDYSEAMRVETVDLKVSLAEPLGLYMAQIASELDMESGRLIAPEAQWRTIESAMNMACSSQGQQPFSFFITPEVSTPFSAIGKILSRIRSDDYPAPSVSLFGIEIVDAASWRKAVRDWSIEHDERLFAGCRDEQPLNAVLIVAHSADGDTIYLQPKLTSSKFEGSVYRGEQLHVGSVLYRFMTGKIAFTTLICSDFFLPDDTGRRVIDTVDFQMMKGEEPVDLIINVQHNRAPDHELFRHSLARLYDRDTPSFCTLFVNSARHEEGQRGASKVLFARSPCLRRVEPVRPYDAPVTGYEVTGEECLVHVQLKGLPRKWKDSTLDPVVVQQFDRNGNGWVAADTGHLRFVTPADSPRLSPDFLTYEDLAARASTLGLYDKAVEWFEAAAGRYEKLRKFGEAARIWGRIAAQYRTQGHYIAAQSAYAESQKLLLQVRDRSALQTRMLGWRLQMGIALVQLYHLRGNIKEMRYLVENVSREIDEALSGDLSPEEQFELGTLKLHALRQRAKVSRMSGQLARAASEYAQVFQEYHYGFAEEKAYARLGEAESLRLAQDWMPAEEAYDDVMTFADHRNDRRLQMRVCRGRAELMRAQGRDADCVRALGEMARRWEKTPYLFGRIYAHLIEGGLSLQRHAAADATHEFEEALTLAKTPAFELRIEMRFARLGLAEALRLDGSPDAVQAYRAVEKEFRDTGLTWGEETARRGTGLALENNRQEIVFLNIP